MTVISITGVEGEIYAIYCGICGTAMEPSKGVGILAVERTYRCVTCGTITQVGTVTGNQPIPKAEREQRVEAIRGRVQALSPVVEGGFRWLATAADDMRMLLGMLEGAEQEIAALRAEIESLQEEHREE